MSSPITKFEDAVKRLVELAEAPNDTVTSEHVHIWDSAPMRTWFLERGYYLYAFHPSEGGDDSERSDLCYPVSLADDPRSKSALATSNCTVDKFPFAYFSNSLRGHPALSIRSERATVFFAEDRAGNHVAIKVVKNDTEECRILNFLLAQQPNGNAEQHDHVIPILDMLPSDLHTFCIMPRWELFTPVCAFNTVQHLFDFVHCSLKGLRTLHRYRIFHGDIRCASILFNHFDNWTTCTQNSFQRKLRNERKLEYAVFDFSHSMLFPRETALARCRLPAQESWRGCWGYRPKDTSQGEYDFNPFAWDVCAMGMTIGEACKPILPLAPLLVPLLDRMMTRNVRQRFTAEQALEFFEQQVCILTTQEQLAQVYPETPLLDTCDPDEDRWSCLSAEFRTQWRHYRQPQLRSSTRTIRYLCSIRPFNILIPSIRRLLHHSANPRADVSRGIQAGS